ncbi:hypothetical protein F5X98DRAFT_386289 [Xylaria grammica]|nr:hypothetical protein F5X98DRAFT_386289 [Xylaria grammica]
MFRNRRHVSQRMSTSTNDITSHRVDYGQNNYNINLEYNNGQNVPDFSDGFGTTSYTGYLSADQGFGDISLSYNAHGPMITQPQFLSQEPEVYEPPEAPSTGPSYVTGGSAQQFPNHIDNMALMHYEPPATGYAAHAVGNSSYENPLHTSLGTMSPASWLPPQGLTHVVQPLPVAATPNEGNSPPYQCLKCPKMPKFRSLGEYNRHCRTVRSHPGDKTVSYGCCCGKWHHRKDNHIRHLQSCKSRVVCGYNCTCHGMYFDWNDYLQHLTGCGRVRCPRRSSNP